MAAFKPNLLFLFASFLLLLLLSPIAFSSNEDQLLEGEVRSPPLVPVKSTPTPTPAPPLKSPPVIPPAPSPAPVYKQPTPTPPPAPKAKSPASPPPPPPAVPAPPPRPRNTKDCYPLCLVRCKLHSRIKICLRACVTCCDRCKCVPPGQYGNYDKCPKCYANMTTHDGRRKCP